MLRNLMGRRVVGRGRSRLGDVMHLLLDLVQHMDGSIT